MQTSCKEKRHFYTDFKNMKYDSKNVNVMLIYQSL